MLKQISEILTDSETSCGSGLDIPVFCFQGKGINLAKYVQSFRRSKSISGFSRLMSDQGLTPGDISDESDDSSFSSFSADDSLFINDDMEESDGNV